MRTYTITGRRDPRLKRVKINGDDIAFKGKKQDGARWREAADDVGLIVNEAKTYESSRWLLINSIFVDMTNKKRVEYIPLSVTIGHNIKRGEVTRTLGQAPAIWELIERCPNSRSRDMCRRIYLRTIDRLCPHLGAFVPNFFLHKDLGGIGIVPPSGWKFGISKLQRKAATYFLRNRAVRAIKEKIMELPKAVSRALEKLNKLRPPTFDFVLKGRPVEGPLRENQEDVLDYLERLLPRCLQSTAYVTGPGKSLDYALFHDYRKALNWHEPSCRTKKLLSYVPAREICQVYACPYESKNCTYLEFGELIVPLPDVESDSDSMPDLVDDGDSYCSYCCLWSHCRHCGTGDRHPCDDCR